MRPRRLRWQRAAITAARGGINTGCRMVCPSLPAPARGMGVQPQALILAVTAQSALGLGALAGGPLFRIGLATSLRRPRTTHKE